MRVHELFVYLTVKDARAALDFYARAFGAIEKLRLTEPGSGRVGHLELQLGEHVVMLAEEYPELGRGAPRPGVDLAFSIHLHVDDADAAVARAVEAGATLISEPADHFYGERSGRIRDPFGHEWLLGHSIEDVSPEEMQRRYDALFA